MHPTAADDYKKHVDFKGRSYAILPNGESRLNVAERLKPLFRTMLEDYQRKQIRHVIIVSHGVTLRVGIMAWMRYPLEWLDAEANSGNCWIRQIQGTRKTGYKDNGNIFGNGAPLNDPTATQRELQGSKDIYMLKPHRPGVITPPGVKLVDPFEYN